ncbi:hypothetical protein CU665_00325, partial [Pseudomonas syringae pv. actinidifoliorum]|nr:hypothetical protein [Pseudomonas syringae pv. actinidifoliorum]
MSVARSITQRFCYVSWICFRPDFVGFLRPDTDPGVAATGHPW